MRSRSFHFVNRICLFGAVVSGFVLAGSRELAAGPLGGPIDLNGEIASSQYLALGPFSTPCGCASQSCITDFHIAPARIADQVPEEEEPITYDPTEAATSEYLGPVDLDGSPIWRLISDGDGNGDMNFDLDDLGGLDVPPGDLSDVLTYVATYIEVADGPQDLDICLRSDDGIQLWVDGLPVLSNNACRGRGAAGDCQDTASVTLDAGVHLLLAGTFERAGGWGMAMRLIDPATGLTVDEFHENIFYLGTDSGGYEPPGAQLGTQILTSPSDPNACPPQVGGPASGTVSRALADGEDPGEPVTVVVDVSGPFSAADVTAEGATSIQDLVDGWITTMLLLGPLAIPGGGNATPGDAALREDHIDDGAGTNETNVMPREGDTQDVDWDIARPSGVSTAGNALQLNPGGVPVWNRWEDADDTINFDDYYGGGVDENTMIAFVYIDVKREIPEAVLAFGSDDSIQLLVDGVEAAILQAARPCGAAGEVQNRISIGSLSAGMHTMLMKVTDGTGGHCFRWRLEDANQVPLGPNDFVPCVDPELTDCQEFAPAGATITWETTKGALDAGLDYEVDLAGGQVTASGDIDGVPLFGQGTATVLPQDFDLGQDLDVDGDGTSEFDYAHVIGGTCPGAGFSVDQDADTITITGNGHDIWTAGDRFTYAYTAVEGDFSARATIVDAQFAANSRWGKHGIMARQNCNPRSRYSFTHDQGADRQDSVRHASRPTHLGSDNFEITPVGDGVHADILRLDRVGSEFISYVWDETGVFSGFPCQWFELGRHDWGLDAPAEVNVGLAVTSHTGSTTSCGEPTTITFGDWELVTGVGAEVEEPFCAPPVSDVACQLNSDGSVDVSWVNDPLAPAAEDIVVRVDGADAVTVSGDSESVTVPADALFGDVSEICVANFNGDGDERCCAIFTGEELYINAGGPRLDDALGTGIGDGRVWQEDTLASPSPFLTSPNANTAAFDFAQFNGVQETDTQLTEPEFIDMGAQLFSTERWNDGPVEYTIPVRGGDYEVQLLFAEGCCSDLCDAFEDPTLSLGACRVFDIFIDDGSSDPIFDEPTFDQFSQAVEVHFGLGGAEGVPTGGAAVYGKSFATEPVIVEDTEQVRVLINDLGGGNPPENASIKGLAVKCLSCDDIGGPVFRRGDVDGSGTVDISDPIANLTNQFLGGAIPCRDAADYNDSGAVDISDPIANLTNQFLGGPPAAPPGSMTCGPDPTPDAGADGGDLGCENPPTNC